MKNRYIIIKKLTVKKEGQIMANKITENTTIFEALEINPKAGEILMSHGMHCLGCALAHGETVGEAADVHGADLKQMLEELNDIEE